MYSDFAALRRPIHCCIIITDISSPQYSIPEGKTLKTKQVTPERRLLGSESAVEGDRISPVTLTKSLNPTTTIIRADRHSNQTECETESQSKRLITAKLLSDRQLGAMNPNKTSQFPLPSQAILLPSN